MKNEKINYSRGGWFGREVFSYAQHIQAVTK